MRHSLRTLPHINSCRKCTIQKELICLLILYTHLYLQKKMYKIYKLFRCMKTKTDAMKMNVRCIDTNISKHLWIKRMRMRYQISIYILLFFLSRACHCSAPAYFDIFILMDVFCNFCRFDRLRNYNGALDRN